MSERDTTDARYMPRLDLDARELEQLRARAREAGRTAPAQVAWLVRQWLGGRQA